MPSSRQRLEVWRGNRLKTSGGLTKADLVKNKRGKIVSKKKSSQAFEQNNLGDFLRKKGKSIPKDQMLIKKGSKAAPEQAKPPKAAPKTGSGAAGPSRKRQQAAPKKKAAPKKAAPKTGSGAAGPSRKRQQVAPKKKAAPKKAAAAPKKKKTKKGINPVTKQPYAKKSQGGFVENAKISTDNIIPKKSKAKKKAKALTDEEYQASFDFAGF